MFFEPNSTLNSLALVLNPSIGALKNNSISSHWFEKIKGEVIYFGKPYPPVYNLSANTKNKKVLCIGDNLNTDIKGANIQNYDSLFITGGVHRKEISKIKLSEILKEHKVKIEYFQTELKW